jgi:hypothetical protein
MHAFIFFHSYINQLLLYPPKWGKSQQRTEDIHLNFRHSIIIGKINQQHFQISA